MRRCLVSRLSARNWKSIIAGSTPVASIIKSRSAELSEAINSMYQWYRDFRVCLVYFADVEIPHDNEDVREMDVRVRSVEKSLVETSGKSDDNLEQALSFGSGIEMTRKRDRCKSHFEDLSSLPEGGHFQRHIARKMCWALKSQTTWVEDAVYCLLGIFGVNMPFLYGEGDNAFLRLQEEIIRRSDVETIFLWADDVGDDLSLRSVVARYPSEFARCRTIVRMEYIGTQPLPYTPTNTGPNLTLRLLPSGPSRPKASVRRWPLHNGKEYVDEELYMPALHCQDSFIPRKMQSIYLRKLKPGGQKFAGVKTHTTIQRAQQSVIRYGSSKI
ncbi:hypothetical protein BCR34DRAFT_654445 [Clohesyomyces aquaticus]|uniref:Heterokaryon incompatibility domain-containing protein n=1 Tax=Clohesyomyces aquaticus TaxID=1231657 RepID=A0A1Y2A764_9PLEO|nr:hypothetical protein BCR34DRAFT_654445 [Clohesyomyces aquaticus]